MKGQSVLSGKWRVIGFTPLKRKVRVELARGDEFKTCFFTMEMISLNPILFRNRTNLFGMEFTSDEIDSFYLAMQRYEIRLWMLKLLQRRDYSRQALQERALKLAVRRKWEPEQINLVLDELIESRLLREAQAIRELITYYADSNYGPEFIFVRLVNKYKYDPELAKEVLATVPDELYLKDMDRIIRILVRNYPRAEASMRQLIYSRLRARGYPEEMARDVVDAFKMPRANQSEALLKDLERYKRMFRDLTPFQRYEKIVKNLMRRGYDFFHIDQVFPKSENRK